MMQIPDGTPAWFALNTADAAVARHFYAATIGWTIAPEPDHGGYRIATAPDDTMIAGLSSAPAAAPSLPGWSIHFATRDVTAAAARVKALGGTIELEPVEVPGAGRIAIARDPQQVGFVLTERDGSAASHAFVQGPHHGHGVWIELATPDPDGALAFYGALFGWTKEGAMPMGSMGDYVFLGSGEARPGALMSSVTTGAPARWNWYAYVPDIDAAIAAATGLGGVLLQGPDQIPGGDYSANIGDPSGAQIGIVGPRLSTAA